MGSDEPHCHVGSLVEEDLIAKVEGPTAQQKCLLLQQEVVPQQNKSGLDGSGSVWVSWKVLVFCRFDSSTFFGVCSNGVPNFGCV